MQVLLQELETRWRQMFTSLAEGHDLPPGTRLRAEGLMEAVVLAGETGPEAVDKLMDACYLEAFGRSLAEDFDTDWRDFYAFPQIPAVTRRAPVFPSTRD